MLDRSLKNADSDQGRYRAFLGGTVIAAMVIVAVSVAILIVAKGVGSALPAIFSGTIFIVVLGLCWLRIEKGDASGDDQGE
jgi:hypothetical protein